MKPRDRQLAAIMREPTDRVSLDVIAIEIIAEVAERLGCDEAEVHDALGVDGRHVGANYSGELPKAADGSDLTEWRTREYGDYGTAHHYPLEHVETVSEVDAFPFPDPCNYDYEAAAEIARALSPTYAIRGPHWVPLFCRACGLMGMEKAIIAMALQPELFEALVEAAFQHTHGRVARLLDACGDDIDILCLGDDFATQRGLMLSPADWRRFLKPRFAMLFDLGKQRGKPVWFHSCGDITSVLPDLIDIGMDVWETVQIHALPISARELKREYGKHLAFFGGINTQRLPFLTPEQVRQHVLDRIRVLGESGGYVCGPDHSVNADVPPENVVALFDAAREAGPIGL